MILKYRQWQNDKKNRCKKEAVGYLTSPEGFALIKRDMLRYLHAQGRFDGEGGEIDDVRSVMLLQLSKKEVDDIESKVKNNLLRARLRHLVESEHDPTTPVVEAAFRYLVRSFEILEGVHGNVHPALGAASLAVASVQNAVGKFDEAREWLGKAIRTMERLDPVPKRALAFCQVQLGNVLLKQKYIEECVSVFSLAVQFYRESARSGIHEHRQKPISMGTNGAALAQTLVYNDLLADDIRQYFTLMEKLVNICNNNGGVNESLEHSVSMLEFAELAFGWDSEEVQMRLNAFLMASSYLHSPFSLFRR